MIMTSISKLGENVVIVGFNSYCCAVAINAAPKFTFNALRLSVIIIIAMT
jgi:hypothetical protein